MDFPTKIAGILKLSSPYKFKSTSNKSEAYLFEPIDYKLPNFIVQSSIGKSSNEDQAVIIEPMNFELELPRGNIISILGSISNENAIQKLHLFHKEIYPKTIKINNKLINPPSLTPDFPLEIYSIDPIGCRDIDDAFSYILPIDYTNSIEKGPEVFKLFIHISNVVNSLEQIGILLEVLEKSITSIYPPNFEPIHMLPNILSTNYLSLLEKTIKPLITLEITYDLSSGKYNYKFYQSIGKITRNYSYEHYPKKFNELFTISNDLYREITGNTIEIIDSHKLIEVFMLIYNYLASKELLEDNIGIFRVQEKSNITPKINIPELSIILKSNSAYYSNIKSVHSSLSLDSYCHITSPIRRVVDIYNQKCLLEKIIDKKLIEQSVDIEKINEINKRLKRLYRDFDSYSLALKLYNEEQEIKTINGYIYETNNETIYIYIPELKLSISYRLFDYELDSIYEIIVSDNFINVYNKQKNQIEWNLELFREYRLTIYGKPNIKKLNRSLLIDIHYE